MLKYWFYWASKPKVFYKNVEVKWSRYSSGVAQRVGRGIALLFHDRGTRRWWVVSSTPRSYFTPGKRRYPFYKRLGGPQGRSGRAKNLVPTVIRSRTVQPVVSRYTDWDTWPTNDFYKFGKVDEDEDQADESKHVDVEYLHYIKCI